MARLTIYGVTPGQELAPTPTPAPTRQAHDDLVHVACDCDPDTALCGTDVTGQGWDDDDVETTCVVCRDLEYQPCARCGQ